MRVSKIGGHKTHVLFLAGSVPELEFVVVAEEGEGFGEEVDADGGLHVERRTCSSGLNRWLTNRSMMQVLPTWQSPSRIIL